MCGVDRKQACGIMPDMAETTDAEQRKKLFLNIVAIVGLVILIAVVVLGLFRIATLSKSWFSSLFGRGASSIQITVPSSPIASGEAAVISWKYSPKEKGAYGFLYQCNGNLLLKTTGTENTAPGVIPCGAAYAVPSTKTSLSLTPILSGTSSLSVPISITFMPTATSGTRAQGNAALQIVSGESTASATPVSTPTPSQNTAPSSSNNSYPVQSSAPYAPDLSVRILSVGVIDPISGDIIPREPTSPYDLVAVRFMIANNGNASTGSWYFAAQLPTNPYTPYTSPLQSSLAPGDSIENMLRFTYAQPGGIFTVSVDPSNQVSESNENNNVASTAI